MVHDMWRRSYPDLYSVGFEGLGINPTSSRRQLRKKPSTKLGSFQFPVMRWLFFQLILGLLSLVHALSSSGSRLLVVIEEASEKDQYSQFWADLESTHPMISDKKLRC